MKPRSGLRVVSALAGVLALACAGSRAARNPAPGSPIWKLNASIGGVYRAEQAYAKRSMDAAQVGAEIQTLTTLIDAGHLGEDGLAVARYWRALAAYLLEADRARQQQAPDANRARQALTDYEWVIQHGVDVPDARVTVADALYGAGLVERNFLHLLPEAYAHWDRCAQLGHAGCRNIMASARLTGEGGVRVDVNEAIELHRQVYETGTAYLCAGAYSAREIALILHFSGATNASGTALEWLQRANRLLDALADGGAPDFCHRADVDVVEYLIRLDGGEEEPGLLRQSAHLAGESEAATLRYLHGQIQGPAFRALAMDQGSKDEACDMLFAAYWRADILGETDLSQTYRASMAELGPPYCGTELALAKLRDARK